MRRFLFFILVVSSFVGGCGVGYSQAASYSTWVPWQVDSVAAAWVLKRYVQPDAKFSSVPRGTSLPTAMALDTPDSPYRRSGRMTAFEQALRLHKVDVSCRGDLKKVVRLLELAPWRKMENPAAEKFEHDLNLLLPAGPTAGGLEAAFNYIDNYCGLTSEEGGQ